MLRDALTLDRLRAMAPGEASAYFVARGADGLSAQEQDLLADWLRADGDHRIAFDRAMAAWRSFDDADDDEILSAMRAHARQARPDGWRSWPRAVAAAAIMLLVVAASMLFLPARRDGPAGQSGASGAQVAWTDYATAHGQVRAIRLADRSVMTLDSDSVAQARLVADGRAIRLERGRALFDVAKDKTRPFAVAAAGRSVVALGTRFEVDTNDGALRVSLFRGKVAIHPLRGDGQTVLLDPGERFTERDGAAKIGPIGGDDPPGWPRGLIELDDTPLGDAVKQVNRYSRAQIVLADPAIAAIRVSGQFRAGDAERFARTVTEVYPVRIVRRANGIELVSAK